MSVVRKDYLTRFQPKLNAIASQPISVFLPKELDAIIRALPNRSHGLRRIIGEAVYAELLPSQPPEHQEPQDRPNENE